MSDKAVDYYYHALEFILIALRLKKCDKTVDTYPSGIQLVSNQYKIWKMYEKAVDTCPFVLASVPGW